MKYESQNALSLFEREQKKPRKPVGPCLYVYAKDAIKQRGVSHFPSYSQYNTVPGVDLHGVRGGALVQDRPPRRKSS